MDTNLTAIAAKAIGQMMIMVVIGIGGYKLGLIGDKERDALTKFLLNLICPMLILNSYMQGYDPEKTKGLFLSLAMGVLIHVIGILLGMIVIKKENNPDWQVERMAIVYGNVGFMGMPLMSAMFGIDAIFYLSAINLVYVFLIWTHGVLLMTGSMDRSNLKKVFISPNMICMAIGILIYALRIPVPQFIASPIASISNCVTPLAMFISGAIIASSNFAEALKHKRLYLVTVMRLFAVPVLSAVCLRVLHIPYMVALITFTAAACPMGSMVTMFAIEHKKNPGYASGIFTVTTVLSLITIPALIALYGMF